MHGGKMTANEIRSTLNTLRLEHNGRNSMDEIWVQMHFHDKIIYHLKFKKVVP